MAAEYRVLILGDTPPNNGDVAIYDAAAGRWQPAPGGGANVHVGTTDPGPTVPDGVEYVWFKTDGAGAVLDILSGLGTGA